MGDRSLPYSVRKHPPSSPERAAAIDALVAGGVTFQQCRELLAELGLELDETVSGWTRRDGGAATIDPVGRVSIGGECRGHFVFDYTSPASEFWAEVVREARDIAPTLSPCPHPVGECEFHDEEPEA